MRGAPACGLSDAADARPQIRALVPAGASVAAEVAEIIAAVRARRRRGAARATRRASAAATHGHALAAAELPTPRSTSRSTASTRGARRARGGDRQRRARWPRPASTRTACVDAARGADRDAARGAGAPRRGLRARRPPPVSVVGRDGRGHGARRGRRRGRTSPPRRTRVMLAAARCAASTRSTGSPARRRSRRWPTARSRSRGWT